jgi:hypothetical protein
MTRAAPNRSPSADAAEATTAAASWDDYGYHHDGLVEPSSLVPMPRRAQPTCSHQETCTGCGGVLRRGMFPAECPDIAPA